MNREQVWREFEALPPLAQQQVVDFIAFLRARTSQGTKKGTASLDLVNDPFIGMWQDREDLVDSNAWVRQVREREWSRTHE